MSGSAKSTSTRTTTRPERIAVVYVHGIGTHPRSTIKEHLALEMARALAHEARRSDPPDRWERDDVAGVLRPDGRVLSAQRLTCIRDDDSPREDVPQLDVYEISWSATVRHGRLRWSALSWMANNVRSILSVIQAPPLAKAFADAAGAVLIAAAILATVVAAGYAVLLVAVIAVWFANAPIPHQISFIGSLVGTLIVLTCAKLLWTFLHWRPAGLPSRDVVHSRTRGGHPRKRFWRFAYDRAPEVTAVGGCLSRAVTASYWFVVVTSIARALSESRIPRATAGAVIGVVLAIGIVTALVRWFTFLEDKFGDIEVFAAEDPLDHGHVERRTRIVEHIRSVVAAVTAADGQYQRVVLMAHSLGSALLADYLADDADRAAAGNAVAAARLRRMSHLVVYGSPIVVFRRYFAMNASDERRRREKGFAQLLGPGIAVPGGTIRLNVLNVWCCGDIISNPFPDELGRCANREIRGMWVFAHGRYTKSPEFWECVLPVLLGDGAPEGAAPVRRRYRTDQRSR